MPVVRSDKDGADPASVAFEASAKAKEANADVLIIDTAGRLQNKSNLMDELGKIRRVTEKNLPVDEVLLVLDATTGQNGMRQAQVFSEAVGITGIVLTKLDVLTGLKEIPICVAYDVDGERYDDMPTDQAAFSAAKPIYETMPGWTEDISQVHEFDELPAACQAYVKRLEDLSNCRISVIGTGPQRDHIISVHSLLD
mgnify:CR=1 FL=1